MTKESLKLIDHNEMSRKKFTSFIAVTRQAVYAGGFEQYGATINLLFKVKEQVGAELGS